MLETFLTAYLFAAIPAGIVVKHVVDGGEAAIDTTVTVVKAPVEFARRTAMDTIMFPVTAYNEAHQVYGAPVVEAPAAPVVRKHKRVVKK